MSVTVIAPCPASSTDMEHLRQLSQSLGPLPDGVSQPALNVWLIEENSALDFLFVLQEKGDARNRGFQVIASDSTR